MQTSNGVSHLTLLLCEFNFKLNLNFKLKFKLRACASELVLTTASLSGTSG